MNDLIVLFSRRGDLAHVALLLWALSASALAWFALREVAAASRRFDDFVRELARFNDTFRRDRVERKRAPREASERTAKT